ncbi:3900_t:CDS:2 [Entrophospora sp. SA101]|nr:3900_t:CDS:2 [Entrophospora sp. SA101]CAJ0836391.1 5054_t:CDS:2 [Entrophospora sp. SA101]CAJ0886960.1 7984_t:CDS:2 [Entrophospora sp. SA101]CAJ0905436.1 13373_t:CDS:2 [Entrophospora sp. SA101]
MAVIYGDFKKRNAINTMVEKLDDVAFELIRIAPNNHSEQVRDIAEVCTAVVHGSELGIRAQVQGIGGAWKLLIDNVNTMVANLTAQVRDITDVLKAATRGDLGKKVTVNVRDLTNNVNLMASNLTAQVRDIAAMCKAVACVDLSRKVRVPTQGEALELKIIISTMVEQLCMFATEVTRVAREMGTEGILGGQAENLTSQVREIANVSKAVVLGDLITRVSLEIGTEGKLGVQAVVEDVDGTWKELTDNVNVMAANLTTQARSIVGVMTAVVHGNFSKKILLMSGVSYLILKTVNSMIEQLCIFAAEITIVAREVGTEVLDLRKTINNMVDQLSTFAAEVTRVTRKVGTEGKLGVQAQVKDISVAATNGDFIQFITVDASSEMDSLKTKINQMV